MQLTSFLVSVLLATAVSAKKNGTEGTSTKAQCKSLAKMTSLIEIANNQTLLDKKTKGNATKAAEIQAKASEAATKITTLNSNATLVEACSVIQAHADSVDSCQAIAKWEKNIATAANTTKLDSKFEGNATKIQEFQAKASEGATKLAAAQANTTLIQFCAVQAEKEDCQSMSKLQKDIATAGNDTKLQAKFDGNTTKIDEFKAKVSKKQAKLDALMANSTLMSACTALSQAQGSNSNTGTTTGAATGSSSSAAPRIEAASGFITASIMVLLGLMVAL